MRRALIAGACAVALGATVGFAQNLPWNNPGGPQGQATTSAGPAPKRDISGIWDAGGGGIGARGMQTSPLTPAGEVVSRTHHSGDGLRQVPADQINDPLSTLADPGGFPRMLLFELRPFEVVQMPNKVRGARSGPMAVNFRPIRIRAGTATRSGAGRTTTRSSSTATAATIARGSTTAAVRTAAI